MVPSSKPSCAASPEANHSQFRRPRCDILCRRAESGELCLLASILGEDRTIVIPDLDPEAELMDLQTIAEALLDRMGFRPLLTQDEDQARAIARERNSGVYPVLLTPLDTGGEKPYEEFVAAGEVDEPWLPGLRKITHQPSDNVNFVLERLARVHDNGGTEAHIAGEIRAAFSDTIHTFRHRASELSLDERL